MEVRICQNSSTPNTASPPTSIRPVAAVHPISAGSAPGIAPIQVAQCERCFIGVYTPT